MMTQELEISVLAAPLAAIDRRELPLAWYRALGYAGESEGASAPPAPAVRPDEGGRTPASSRNARSLRVPLGGYYASRPGSASRRGPQPLALDPERTLATDASAMLARRIAGALIGARAALSRVTFSVESGRARVHVVFQDRGDRVAILAICRPELRAVVARALAQVRLALRARGVVVDLQTKGVRECF